MVEKIIDTIFDYLTSPKFTATVATIAVIWNTILQPIIKKAIKSKTELKNAIKEAKIKALEQENGELKALAALVPYINEKLDAQADALKTAFNNSNLKADVKELIDNKLTQIKAIELEDPKNEELVKHDKEPRGLPTEDENKKAPNTSIEIVL